MTKKIISTLLVLTAGALVGLLLLAGAFCVPISESRRQEVFDQFEGGYPRESIHVLGSESVIDEEYPDILDYASDYLILRFSTENPAENPILHALRVPVHEDGYYRYWHGYAVVWRLLFLLFDLAEIRMLNQGIQLFLVFLLGIAVFRRTQSLKPVLAVLTVYFLMMPAALGNTLQYSFIFYLAIIASMLCLKWASAEDNRILYMFLVVGMLTSYFDLLTFPLLTWALPMVVLIMSIQSKHIVKTILTAIMWVIGYVVFWTEKWILATLILRVDCFGNAMGAVESKSGVDSGILGRFSSLVVNWKTFGYAPYLLAILLWVLYWSICICKKGFSEDSKILACGLVCSSPIAWCLAASQHTYSHHFFTWRTFLALITAFLAVICITADTKERHMKSRKLPIGLVCVCLVCSVIGTLVVNRDTIVSDNFANPNQVEVKLDVNSDEAACFSFVPQESHIVEITPVLQASGDDVKGTYGIGLRDGNQCIYEEILPIDQFAGSNFHSFKVNWHLEKGRSYDLVITTKGLQGQGSYWTVEAGDMEELSEQSQPPVMGVKYAVLPIGIYKKIFCLVSWYGGLLMLSNLVFVLGRKWKTKR